MSGDADPTLDFFFLQDNDITQCSIIHIREERPFLDLSSDMCSRLSINKFESPYSFCHDMIEPLISTASS